MMRKKLALLGLPGFILLFLFLISPSPDTVQSTDFTQAAVLSTGSFTNTVLSNVMGLDTNDSTLAVDSQGRYYIAYTETDNGDGDIIYAWVDPVTGPLAWYQAVNTYDERMPSIVVDQNDESQIIFVRDDSVGKGDIIQVIDSQPEWIYTPVSSDPADEIAPSAAIDPWGHVHVAYMRKFGADNYEIYYATNYTFSWVNTRLTTNTTPDFFPTIALDGNGDPHVAWMRDGAIYHATNSSGAWVTTEVASGDNIYSHPSIAVGAGGYIYIAYQELEQDPVNPLYQLSVYYTTNRYGAWTDEKVAGPYLMDVYHDVTPQIALDYGNKAYIAYQHPIDHQIYLATHHGYQNWQSTVVSEYATDLALSLNDRSFLIDDQGHAMVTYTSEGDPAAVNQTVIMGARSHEPVGPRWIYKDVGPSTYNGWNWDTDLVLYKDKFPYISYYDAVNNVLSLSYMNESYPNWQSATVDLSSAGLDCGQYNGVSVNNGGRFSMPFYEATDGDLRLLDEENPGVIPSLDSAGDVGMYLSYVATEDARHISYYDATHKNLKYAVASAPNWSWMTRTVESGADVGWFTSIDLDFMGNPHIAYYDANQQLLKYASYDGSDWTIETVDTSIYFYGAPFDITLKMGLYEGVDFPHIVYYDAANTGLKYARWDGAIWRIETVDNNGDVGQYNALAVDAGDLPHIVYSDYYNHDLKIAHWDGWEWHYGWVDKPGLVGDFLSIDLDIINKPHISYFDGTNDKVKYAYLEAYDIALPMVIR
ncbi:MAG: hypothetical protein E4H27_01595 [Anaerolineales bacterium]|nr:MAG: hypothetical protein E4H27_01595 [Anaerolineales bacterium]